MGDIWAHWVLVEVRIHRLNPHQRATMCGHQLQTEARKYNRSQTLDLIRRTRQSVCGRCDREVERARREALAEKDNPVSPRGPGRLTPEQQKIRDFLDQEKSRRERLRAIASAGTVEKSLSIRTVRGGLPTLGKRRK